MKKNNVIRGVFSLVLVTTLVFAQDHDGRLTGQVTGPFDGLVADAPLRATHLASGDSWQSRTDTVGHYEFVNLPAGEYRLQVRIPCCEYKPYQSDPFVLQSGAVRTVDIQLEQGFQLNTIGDDGGIATAQILAEQDVPDLPRPQTAEGRPDLTGMWMYGGDPFPTAPVFTDWAAKLVDERNKNFFVDSPRFRCLPTSLPIPTHTPPTFGKFVHTEDLIVILYEGILGFRQIFMDGRGHAEDFDPSWLGHSIGWWEDDVLVVDTVGFNDRGWTGVNQPRSEDFHVIERYQRTSYGDMELELTIEDPAVYKVPWVRQMPLYLTPNEVLFEFVCENEKWLKSVSN
jgi:hypothetical protein